MEKNNNWKIISFVLGGVIGAAAGVLTAFILVQRAEKEEALPRVSAGEGIQLGLGLLGLMRLVSSWIEIENKK
jgi:hypothetical protein